MAQLDGSKLHQFVGKMLGGTRWLGLASLVAVWPMTALAESINPFNNIQPSLAVTEVTPASGIFPSNGGGGAPSGDTLGFVYDFAGSYTPSGTFDANGRLLTIAQNGALFSIVGTTYGGNGGNSFAVPDLQGRATIGAGTQSLGVPIGAATVTLSANQIPPVGTQPFSNLQPSLPLTPLIASSGFFPTQGGAGTSTFLGQIAYFAGNYTPAGWTPADGRLLPIAQNGALFSIIGTTYGGNGVTNFALPNLQGTVAVGADGTHPIGTTFGQQSTVVTTAQLPPGGAPVNNDQPSLALEYLIAITGIFPSETGGNPFNSTVPTLGEIVEFAGNFVPSGWALADGQLLPIAQNGALYSIIGTTYGGNGVTNFALPDFDGRTAIGSGDGYSVGELVGTDQVTLTGNVSSNITPLPSTWTMLIPGLGGLGLLGWRRKHKSRVSLLGVAFCNGLELVNPFLHSRDIRPPGSCFCPGSARWLPPDGV